MIRIASIIATRLRLPALARRFRRDRGGLAAVEFAMLLPLMVLLYFGTVELTQGFSANRKLTYVARDLADLAAQQTALTDSLTTTIFSATAGVFYPFTISPFAGAKLTLTGIVFKTAADGKVHAYTDWSVASNGGTLRGCGELQRTSVAGNAPPAVPDGLFVASTSLIAADATFSYTPMIGSTFISIGSNGTQLGSGSVTSIPMSKTIYMAPRTVARVAYSGTGACAGVTFP